MRLLALTGVCLIALVGASTAQAHHLPGSPVVTSSGTPTVTSDAWAEIIDRAVRPTTPDPGLATQPQVDKRMYRLRAASRVLPKIGPALGTLAIGTAAFTIGWEIGGALQPTIFAELFGDAGVRASGTSNPEWCYRSTGIVSGSSTYNGTDLGGPAWIVFSDGLCGLSEYISIPDGGFGNNAFNVVMEGVEASGSDWTILSTGCCGGGGRTSRLMYRTDEEMAESLTYEPMTSGEYASYPGTKRTTTYDAPGDLGTTADKQAAAAMLGTGSGHSSDPAQEAVEQATEEAICNEAGLGDCEPAPTTLTLPQPTINETYSAYIARLEALGWIGSATSTVVTTELSGYGPEAPVRIIFTDPTTTTVRTLDPLQWPATAVTINEDTNLTIRYNPDTAPEAPTEGTGTGTQVTLPPTTVPTTPALDFTPLTDIDFGCKFPYGFICYAVAVTESFDIAEDAPRFVFDIPAVEVASVGYGGGDDDWIVDLEVVDGYMSLWRSIWSVVLWVGGVYLLATRLLGFGAGGDPGAAMDDAL